MEKFMTNEVDKKELLKTKLKLVLIICVFGLPMVGAMIMAQLSKDGLPDFIGTTNYGVFVDPVVPLTSLALQDEAGEPITYETLQDFWTIAYISTQGCGEICQQQIFALRQLRLMNGKNIEKIQRLFVYDNLSDQEVVSVRDAFPGLVMATGDADALSKATALLQQPGHADSDRIYLIDPKGNLMMSYAKDINPRHIYFDMKKLLKIIK
jgi:cytochrome oxidase Cu insertion factor (SCO1/SenC/PrrC family)